MIPHHRFDLHFSNNDIEHLFMYLLDICMSSLGICFVSIVCCFVIESYELFVYFVNSALVSCIICKYLLPFCKLSFFFVMVSFAVEKLVSVIRSHLFIFAFISIALGDWPKKTLLLLFSC